MPDDGCDLSIVNAGQLLHRQWFKVWALTLYSELLKRQMVSDSQVTLGPFGMTVAGAVFGKSR